MKPLTILTVLAVVAAACGGSDDAAPSTTPAATAAAGSGTTVAATGGTTTTADPGSTTTSTTGKTTTTTGATTETTRPAGAVFAISRVVFGDDGYVSVTNIGSEAGNLEGWQLCQRPAYYGVGSVMVAAGETVHFTDGEVAGLTGRAIDAGGRFGPLRDSGGELGLYSNSSFGSSSAIRSYVEWGSSPHGRSSVAWEAGIWPQDAFVDSAGAPGIAATAALPVSPEDWANS